MAENNKKQTGNGQELKSHWVSIRFEITMYIIWKSIVNSFKNIFFIMVPAADRRAGGRFSFAIHTIFAVLTLEGPRLLLMSRYRAARMKTGTKVGLSAVSGTAIAAIAVATLIVSSQLMAVTVDGRIVGYVENQEQYESLLQQAKDRISAQVGTDNTEVMIQEDSISLEPVIAPQQSPMTVAADPAADPADTVTEGTGTEGALTGTSTDANTGSGTDLPEGSTVESSGTMDIEEALIDTLVGTLLDGSAVKATVYTITINGNVMATLGSMKEAREVLNFIADAYLPAEGDFIGRWLDDLTINGVTTTLEEVAVQDPKEVAAFLLAGVTETRTYTAVEEDNLENICAALGLSEEELKGQYNEYDFDKIEEGDEFGSTLTFPYLRYETSGLEVSNEEVPYGSEEENTNTLFLGQREVKEEGEVGEREVTRSVTRVNGRITSAVEINSVTIIEPKPEIVYVGTKLVYYGDSYVGPSDGYGGGGNGPLGRPLNSWYLSRSVGNGHAGADMLAPRGTPIFAAEGGTVTYTGVQGGYGNLVIIDHGNGLQTYYAHCDTINVGTGQGVSRGQQIATVGTTGRSTAYHLHFEVRVGGAVQEPLNWIG